MGLGLKKGFQFQSHGKTQKAIYTIMERQVCFEIKQINFRKHFDTRHKFFLLQTFLNDKMGEEESPVLVRKRSCIKRGERKKSECSSA